MDIVSQLARLLVYMVEQTICDIDGTQLDCIYNLDSLGFESSTFNSDNVHSKKVEVQDPLVEVILVMMEKISRHT